MFRNLKKERTLVDREVELYKNEKILAVDKLVGDYLIKRQQEMQDMAKRCHEELGQYEHTYHFTKEQKGIEIAKLEAKIEALTDVVKAREEVIRADNNLLTSKNAEIQRLTDLITLLIKEQPKHTTTVQQLK